MRQALVLAMGLAAIAGCSPALLQAVGLSTGSAGGPATGNAPIAASQSQTKDIVPAPTPTPGTPRFSPQPGASPTAGVDPTPGPDPTPQPGTGTVIPVINL